MAVAASLPWLNPTIYLEKATRSRGLQLKLVCNEGEARLVANVVSRFAHIFTTGGAPAEKNHPKDVGYLMVKEIQCVRQGGKKIWGPTLGQAQELDHIYLGLRNWIYDQERFGSNAANGW